MFPAVICLLLVIVLPFSKGFCCKSLKISLSGRAAKNHPETSGIYSKDPRRPDSKPSYSQVTGSKTWKIEYNDYWKVYKIPGASKLSRLREAVISRSDCPIHIQWEYHCWNCNPAKWLKDSTILVKCENNHTTRINTTTPTSTTTTIPQKITPVKSLKGLLTKEIIGGAGGGLLFMLIAVSLLYCLWKSSRNDPEDNEQVDDNPIYMDDYEDPDSDNEIYDRNAYYAAEDMEEVAEISTVARDLNPDYETSL